MLKVPHFTAVTGTITTGEWNGSDGGVVVFRAFSVNASVIDVSGKGYRGGSPSVGQAPGFGEHGKHGEGSAGPAGGQTESANSEGGGGGFGNEGGDGGRGGGHALAGANGDQRGAPGQGGQGGGSAGEPTLSLVTFLGGGGGSGGGEGNASAVSVSGPGGRGGGIAMVYAKTVSLSDGIHANGLPGGNASRVEEGSGGGGGGGGAGGSILVRSFDASLGSSTSATGGAGGSKGRPGTGDSGDGGAGAPGRIRIEYCGSLAGTTVPPASAQQLTCYIADQAPPQTSGVTRLTLPETFTGGKTYQVQYGRLLNPNASGQLTTLRVAAGQFSAVSLHALVSGTGTGVATMSIDVGNDGSVECTYSGTPGQGADQLCNGTALRDAFNSWWTIHGGGGQIDVPVRVTLSPAGQVIITDLQMTPAASSTGFVRLAAGSYSDVRVDVIAGDSAGGSGPLSVAVDVGADGDIDWQTDYAAATFPFKLTTGNVAAGVNEFLTGKTGDVDVPIRVYLTPAISRRLVGFTAISTARPDLRTSAPGFGGGAASEGDPIAVSATITNGGAAAAAGVAVSFFATAPGWGRTYIGSSFLASLSSTPGSNTAVASITWNTLGFYGSVSGRSSRRCVQPHPGIEREQQHVEHGRVHRLSSGPRSHRAGDGRSYGHRRESARELRRYRPQQWPDCNPVDDGHAVRRQS